MRSKDRVNQTVRAFFYGFLLLGVLLNAMDAQPRKRPPSYFVQPRPPDREEGLRILEASRNIGLAGSYFFEFELLIRPRDGDQSKLTGRWFGARNATGAITRIEIARRDGGFETWLIQSGQNPAVWLAENVAVGDLVEGVALNERRLDTTISPSDLQLPFMYWEDHVYEGLTRFRGRPTHVFLLFPPDTAGQGDFEYAGARVFIDTAYSAISQAQWVDENGDALKTITVIGLKKVNESWIVKSFEVRDDQTRDKTRLKVTAVALDAPLPGRLFSPAESFEPAAVAIDSDQLVHID